MTENSPILILLAGGKSSRMGFPKGLLDFHGKHWILEQISRFKYAKSPRVYIGLGYDYQKYFKAISWFKEASTNFYLFEGIEVRVIINHKPELGSFSTLLTVLKKIDKNSSVLVQPIDVPLLNTKDLGLIIKEDDTVVIPKCDSKNGHPVKLKPEFWKTLLSVNILFKEARLDFQIKNNKSSTITYLDIIDNYIYQNINTSKDWNIYLKNN